MSDEKRRELEKKVSLAAQMLATERELCGRAGRETYPRQDLYSAADALRELPLADPDEGLDREYAEGPRRPRSHVEMAAGIAAQIYSEAQQIRMDHLLDLWKEPGSLPEALHALEEAAWNVVLELGQVLRQEGDMITVYESAHAEVA